MPDPSLSFHARARMQQRGIQQEVLDLLFQFGRYRHCHDGRELVFMDHHSRRIAVRYCGRAAGPAVDRAAHLFAVLGSDGVIVTVGHRRRRIPRH